MAWNSVTNYNSGDSPVLSTVLNGIGLDIRTWGGDVDADDNNLVNLGQLRLTPAALPGSPSNYTLCVDSGDGNKLKYYDGSAWRIMGGSGLADPGSNGIIKRTAANVTATAVAGTDYAAATNGTAGQALVSNGAGGWGTALDVSATATANSLAKRNASSEVIAANCVATGKTPMATDTAVQASQLPALTGDVTSSAGSAATSVVKLQGRAFASTAPTDGQAIVWDNAGSTWKPGTVSGSGSQTPWTSNINANGYSLSTLASLTFQNSASQTDVSSYAAADTAYFQFYQGSSFVRALDIVSNGASGGNAGRIRFFCSNATNATLRVVMGGSYDLQVLSDSAAKPTTNTWTVASDERLKRNIAPFTDGLDAVLALNPISYELNGLGGLPEGARGISVLAQDAQPVIPYCIGSHRGKLHPEDEEETDLLDLNTGALTWVFVNAIKSLDARMKAAGL